MTTPPQQQKPSQSPASPSPDPEEDKAVRRSGRHLLVFAILVFATLITSSYALPWKLAAIAFGLAALVQAVVAIVASIRAKAGQMLPVTIGVGALLTCWMVLQVAALAAIWPIQATYEDCLAGSLTEESNRQCEEAYEDSRQEFADQFLPSS